MIDTLRTEITTNSSGAASKTTGSLNGKLLGVAVKLGTATAIDLAVADADGINLLTKTTINASGRINPRAIESLNTDGSALASHDSQPVVGPLTLTIANGGDTKTAGIILYMESD